MGAREVDLGINIVTQGLLRIVFDTDVVKYRVPQTNDVFQYGCVDADFILKVVVHIGFRYSCGVSDALHAGAIEAMLRKSLGGSLQNFFFRLLTDLAGLIRAPWSVAGHGGLLRPLTDGVKLLESKFIRKWSGFKKLTI